MVLQTECVRSAGPGAAHDGRMQERFSRWLCFMSGLRLIGREREQGVRAGEESNQPQTAPAEAPGAATAPSPATQRLFRRCRRA